MMICTDCKQEIRWGGDHSYEDYGLEGEGIVSNYTCGNELCSVTDILIYREL